MTPPTWFETAQEYEAKWSQAWLDDGDRGYIDFCGEFFAGDAAAYLAFRRSLAGKTVLEVGCGPNPIVTAWSAAKRRILVDPLLGQLAARMPQLRGGVEVIAARGEDCLPAMAGMIDGAIVSRNAVDHTDTPVALLRAICASAAPGCHLFYWSDWHHEAPDAGHHSFAESEAEVRVIVEAAGFEILREIHVRSVAHTRDWGAVAVRR